MDFLAEYLGELILIVGIGILKLFGRNETAEALMKKRKKRRRKQEKKVKKEAQKLEKDLETLKELE